MAEGKSGNPEMNDYVTAQLEFMETLTSLDQLLQAEAHENARKRDSERRGRLVFEALRDAAGRDVVENWENDWKGRSKAAIQSLADEAELKKELDRIESDALDKLMEMIESLGENTSSLNVAVQQSKLRPKPEELIYRAILVSAVSAFEGAMASAYRAILSAKPEEVMSGTKEFSLADLARFSSISDAFSDAVERRVDAALRGGLEDWAAVFIKFNIHFQQIATDWGATTEVFMRRNAYIHTQGKVNATYASKVASSPAKGEPLPLDEEYLREAISRIMTLGTLVMSRVQQTLQPEGSLTAVGIPYLYMDELMRLGYWQGVRDICANLKGLDVRLDLKFELRFTHWLARKKLTGVQSIRKEVESLDVTALKPQFGFKKAILLDDWDSAMTLLSEARERSESWAHGIEGSSFVEHQPDAHREITKRLDSLEGSTADLNGDRQLPPTPPSEPGS
ncbi:hypothetical protein [Streptomyces sp. NPDC127103]|uniref:hypothetical protein n=1 Tax=Streptomyces sp. NPDC127103 TaxID=3347139 RepID=UPI003664057A